MVDRACILEFDNWDPVYFVLKTIQTSELVVAMDSQLHQQPNPHGYRVFLALRSPEHLTAIRGYERNHLV